MGFRLGTDVELMIANSDSMGSAAFVEEMERIFDLIGTKTNPLMLEGVIPVHRDNMFIEFSIPPASSPADFTRMFLAAKQDVEDLVGRKLYGARAMRFDPIVLELMSEVATEFGCSADYSVTHARRRHVPRWLAESSYREMGGHLHLDHECAVPWLTQSDIMAVSMAVQEFEDQLSEAPMLEEFRIIPAVDGYRPWYRRPGTFRPTPYGFEYRSLGSGWCNKPTAVRNIADAAFRFMEAA